MKKLLCYHRNFRSFAIAGMVLICSLVWAQNLVPNPSFEEYSSCPDNFHQICYAYNWESFSEGGQEYFNYCDINNWLSVPRNVFGYQNAYDGKAYAGLYFNNPLSVNQRESIGCKLIDSLKVGHTYYVSYYVSLADESIYSCNNIGILLSTKNYNESLCYSSYFSLIRNFSHINEINVIKDTLNWHKISGIITVDSSYQYIIIGNFFDDYNTNTDTFNYGGNTGAYYYVDMVCVSEDSLECDVTGSINDIECNNNYTIIQNPASNDIYINYVYQNNVLTIYSIYDVLGRNIKKGEFYDNTSINVSFLEKGIYFLNLKTNKNSVTKKIIIN